MEKPKHLTFVQDITPYVPKSIGADHMKKPSTCNKEKHCFLI
ncbi:hypothetical protein ACKUSY_06790 [Myroides odoratus]